MAATVIISARSGEAHCRQKVGPAWGTAAPQTWLRSEGPTAPGRQTWGCGPSASVTWCWSSNTTPTPQQCYAQRPSPPKVSPCKLGLQQSNTFSHATRRSVFELLRWSLKLQERLPDAHVSDHRPSDGLDGRPPLWRGFVSFQGSVSESTNILYEVTFPARVLKSYSVRKAFLSPYFISLVGGVLDKYGVGVSLVHELSWLTVHPLLLSVCP